MLFGLIDRTTNAAPLKQALDASVQRARAIGDRVAKASLANADGFALPGEPAAVDEAGQPIDVEAEMVALADEQLRFLTASKLLERTYASLRTAIRGER